MAAIDQQVKCLRCGHVLRSPKSIAGKYGPVCAAKIRKAATEQALTGFTEDQHAKAVELIADGGIVPTSRPGVYAATSSDGSTYYVVNLADPGCTCAAGQHGRPCYHVAAARILQAAAAATTTRKAA